MVEMPGIGCSPILGRPYLDEAVDGLERLRRLLRIKRWSVFSYSSGTRVAEKYIQVYPTYVERVVFLCPAQISASRAFGLNMLTRVDRFLPEFGYWILSGPRLRFLIDLLGFNLKKNPLSPRWFAEISSQPTQVLKETLCSLPDSGRRPFCVPKHIPALFVWGSEDWIVKAPHRQTSQDCMIQATHSAPLTAPQQVFESIFPFLSSADGPS
jgi:pimeloyl-ACP methyl ester carboxylesterase